MDRPTPTSSVVGRMIKSIELKAQPDTQVSSPSIEPLLVAPCYISGRREAKEFAQDHPASKQQTEDSD